MARTARKPKTLPPVTPEFTEDQPQSADVIRLSPRAAGSRIADRRMLPWSALRSSPLNPRKHFDATEVATLAANIAEHGVLQNLTVRFIGEETYEVVIGDRRYRAVGHLVGEGIADADFQLPVVVESFDDKEVLTIAMAENMARQDLTPMEEARGLAALVGLGAETADLAKRVGRTQRYIQQRLALVNKLAPSAQAALDENKITVSQARAMTLAPVKEQATMVKNVVRDNAAGDAPRESDIKEDILGDMVPVNVALFERELYTGEVVRDDDTDQEFFADAKLFDKLQTEGIKAKCLQLEGSHAKVIVFDRNSHFYRDDYRKAKPGEDSIAVLELPWNRTGQVKIHTDLILKNTDSNSAKSKGKAAKAEKPKAAAPEEAFTKAHRVHAHIRKTKVLQRAVALDPVAAQRIICMSLLLEEGFDPSTVRREGSYNPCRFGDYRGLVLDAEVIEGLRKILPKKIKIDDKADGAGIDYPYDDDAEKTWQWIFGLTPAQVAKLFAHLVAITVGSWAHNHGALEDDPAACDLAEHLRIAGKEKEHGLTLELGDLEGLRKPALLGVAARVKAMKTADGKLVDESLTASAIRDAIADKIEGSETKLVLPTMTFLFESDMDAAVKALIKEGK